jgi:DNA ligase (NAD+)
MKAGISKISDYKYDILYKILEDLEELIHETIPTSITRMVGIKSERKSELNVKSKFKSSNKF